MRARLSDIAASRRESARRRCRGCSTTAPGSSPETRQAVLAALDVLGYERPARLRKRSAGLVGLVVPELENPIFPAFAQIIETALAQTGYTPVLCTQTPGGVTEDEYVEMLLDRRSAASSSSPALHADTTADLERYHKLVARALPIVLVNGYAKGIEAPFVSCDDGRPASWPWRTSWRSATAASASSPGPSGSCRCSASSPGFRAAMTRLIGASDAEIDALVALSLFGVEGGGGRRPAACSTEG